MFATNNDYEEAVKGARIHAYEHRENKKRTLGKVLSFSTVTVVLMFGFYAYQKHTIEELKLKVENFMPNSEPIVNKVVDNSLLTQEVLEIGSNESKSDEDEYLNSLKSKADESVKEVAQKDDYLIALESMEVDVLDNSQQESVALSSMTETPDLNQMNLSEAMNNLVDETIADNSHYTKDLQKEVISENKSKSKLVVVKKGDTLKRISNKSYGNSMKYKAIMASNSNLLDNANVIYDGEELTLP